MLQVILLHFPFYAPGLRLCSAIISNTKSVNGFSYFLALAANFGLFLSPTLAACPASAFPSVFIFVLLVLLLNLKVGDRLTQ